MARIMSNVLPDRPRPGRGAEEAASDGATRFAAATACGLSFRPMTGEDLPFLAGLYASTRTGELVQVPWSAAQKAMFLQSQFEAQHAHYQAHYPTAQWWVICRDGTAVGRLYLDHWPHEHRLIDLALLPAQRGRGYGTAVLRDLIAAAARAGKPLSIHVEADNPAMLLYRRLGFRDAGDHGPYVLMMLAPP